MAKMSQAIGWLLMSRYERQSGASPGRQACVL